MSYTEGKVVNGVPLGPDNAPGYKEFENAEGSIEVVVELSPTERKLAEGTAGLGAQVCFMRKHQFGVYMKIVGSIRILTSRVLNGKEVFFAVVTMVDRPTQMVRK